MTLLRKCEKCEKYTMKKECTCKTKTKNAHYEFTRTPNPPPKTEPRNKRLKKLIE